MNLNPIEKIKEKDIKKVVQLDNRPNVSGGYGQAKLSAEQLKAWFDAYPAIVRQKVDDIISILSSGERSGDYIALRLEREDKDGSKITLGLSLYDLIESFANGSWADYFTVQTAQSTESESLIACLNGILKTIGNSDTSDETVLGRLAHLEEENKTQATEIAENAKGIASNKAYAEQNTVRIVKNETDIANTAKDITQIKRRLQFVEGATLSVESNSEVAFEKITPTNAGTYATIEKIGCITVRNNNICIADGHYELKDELGFEIKLGVLEAGEYTFYFEGDFTGASGISCSGESIIEPRNDITANTSFTLSVFEKEDVSLHLYSVAADSNPEEPGWDTYPRLNGTITGIMLCNASDADKSYRPYFRSDNLCKADGRYDLSAKGVTYEEQMIPLDLGVLGVGTYQLQWYGDIRYLYYITIAGDVRKPEYYDTELYNNYIIIEVLAESQVTVTLKSEWYEHGHEGGHAWDGVITGIMLVKIPDAESPILDLKYEEKQGALRKAKPTGIESRGANLLNINCPESLPSGTASTNTTKRLFEPNTCIVGLTRNNYYKPAEVSLDARSENAFSLTTKSTGYGLAFALKLNPNTTYTVSYESTATRSTVAYSFYDNDGTNLSNNYVEEKYFTFTTDNYGNVLLLFSSSAVESFTISNIMLTKGTEVAPYKPYSAEPIDTFALPENIEEGIKKAYEDAGIQYDVGWGLGIDAEYNNHIVLRNGRIFYVHMLDELDLGDFDWRYLASTKYFVTYPSWSPETWENVDLPEYTTAQQGIAISAGYEVLPTVKITRLDGKDKSIGFVNPHATYERMIVLRNNAYTSKALDTNSEELRASLKGEKLIYLLKTPIETDITHLFPNFSGYIDITTEAGGSVFAINKYSLPVPWTITYITKA